MFFIKHTLCIATCVAACASMACAGQSPKSIRLLTVGNSFSGNATHFLRDIAASTGREIILQRADLPGCPMERHWRLVEAAEAKPASPEGRPYSIAVDGKARQMSLREILRSDKWDVVTIQQASPISTDISGYRPYARKLRDYIRKHAPQAEVVVHETWAYRRDDPRFATGEDSQELMYRKLRAAYETIAGELDLRIIPVGDALYLADTDKRWGYRPASFDPAMLKHPDLPDQKHSLHAGWQWSKNPDGTPRLFMDGHHASALGQYLAACVWFEFLFDADAKEVTFVPKGIPVSTAKYLRAVAHSAVSARR